MKIDIIPIVHNRCTVRVKYLKLHTAYSTVQTHYAHIMEKLNLQNRAALIKYAIKQRVD